uniref:Cytochrome P450 family 4 subfamily F member 8 n=1 Tax=Astatotilapia calliptera TaxID=8154 RepID=A0A3P8PFV5_ASTCA
MMTLLHTVLALVLSWTGLSSVLYIFSTGLFTVVALWTARLLLRHAWYTHKLSCFSKPQTRSWLLGHLGKMQSTEEGLQRVDDLVQTYKHSCCWFLGPFYHLVRLFHPDYVKPLLMAPASITVKDELIYHNLQPWLGNSVLISNGEVWSRKRRLLTPAFHFDILKSYIAVFNSSAKTMHDKWCRLVAEGKTNLEMFDHVTLMTLDSLLKCAFSYDSNCQQSSSEYVSAIVELSDLIIERREKNILHHWDWIYWKTRQGERFKQALNTVHRFTRDVVEKRRTLLNQQRETEAQSEIAPTAQKRKDFVDILLLTKDEDGQGLTDEEMQAEANTFMFAGHDTTASAICWTLYNLARHEHYQEKCRQEVMDLIEGRDGQEIQEDLSNLPFTTMCIKESLRLHSPVQAVTRSYTQDMVLPGNRTVPAGTICLVSIYGTHHNPTVWTNPHEYDPQRFDPSNKKSQTSHAFIPFSSGPRNCIGQKFAMVELRVVVALTLLRFRLTPGVNPELGSSRVRRLPQLVLRAEGGLWLQLEPLNTIYVDAH